MPWTFKWTLQITDHLFFCVIIYRILGFFLTCEIFTRLLMFWSPHSFPSLPIDRSIFWWFWRIVVICTMWPYSLYSDYYMFSTWDGLISKFITLLALCMVCERGYGLVWWTWIYCCYMSVMSVVTYIEWIFPPSPPHPHLLTLNTSHSYHLPCLSENLTRWTPEKTIFLYFFLLSAQLHSFFFTLSSPPHTVL